MGQTLTRTFASQVETLKRYRSGGEPSAAGLPQGRNQRGNVYNWRKKYAGLMPSEMKRLRQLEEENSKLKRIVADLSLDKAMLQDVRSKKL
jgi:putative transposase